MRQHIRRRRGRRRCRAGASSPPTRRPIASSPPSWCAISSPTIHRRTQSASLRPYYATAMAIWASTSAALLELPDAWQPGAKLRTPLDYVVASIRALDLPADRATQHDRHPCTASASRFGAHRRRMAGPTVPRTGRHRRPCCAGSTGPADLPAGSVATTSWKSPTQPSVRLLRPATQRRDPPRRLPPGGDDAAADQSRIPEAMIHGAAPAAPPCWA